MASLRRRRGSSTSTPTSNRASAMTASARPSTSRRVPRAAPQRERSASVAKLWKRSSSRAEKWARKAARWRESTSRLAATRITSPAPGASASGAGRQSGGRIGGAGVIERSVVLLDQIVRARDEDAQQLQRPHTVALAYREHPPLRVHQADLAPAGKRRSADP